MQLSDLPEEILIIIVQDLDYFTQESIYNTCQRLRNIICLHGVVTKCSLTQNVMATAKTLKSSFFKDIAHQLVEVNMCGVSDLSKTRFLPALKKLKMLRTLDVSYTNLHIADLLEIPKICPTLKDISINLTCSECLKIPKKMLLKCQSVFEQFENIHFVGSIIYLLHSKIVPCLVEKATLNSLKYTIADKGCFHYINDSFEEYDFIVPNFNQFYIYIVYSGIKEPLRHTEHDLDIFHYPIIQCQILRCDTIIIYLIIRIKEFEPEVWASSIFSKFFKEYFNVTIINDPLSDLHPYGNLVIMMWNMETTTFDDNFYKTLLKHVKQYIPYQIKINDEPNVLLDPAKRNWFYTVPLSNVCHNVTNPIESNEISRKRQAAPNITLNYDEIFKDKHQVELSLRFTYPTNTVYSLNTNCNYLRKLTYLSLDRLGLMDSNFFNVLFHCCDNLVTLSVHALPVSPCSTIAISRSIPISKSLRNIRLVDKRINMTTLFNSLSDCQNLENIYVEDDSEMECNILADPCAIIKKCKRLHSFCIVAKMTSKVKLKTLRMLNKAKATFKKDHLNVKLKNRNEPPLRYHTACEYDERYYDPYVHVFRIDPIRPL